MFIILVLCALSVYGVTLEEGDYCENNGFSGICKNIRRCPSAIAGIKNKEYPKTCSFIGSDPVVCCHNNSAVLPSTKPPTFVTPGEIGESLVDTYTPLPPPEALCDAIPPNITAEKTGQRAWDTCVEYQQKLVLPCENVGYERYSRVNRCTYNAQELIVGYAHAQEHEFPHMAQLGFKDSGNITWEPSCAGALVHDRFVLSSAHCTKSRENGAAVSHVRLSSQRKNNVHAVRKVVAHPSYEGRSQYRDIALLELENPVQLDHFTVPACLVGGVGELAFLTGWADDSPEILHKNRVAKLSHGDCKTEFPATRKLRNDVDENSQACYKDQDTLQKIRGGVLQTRNKIWCMYTLVGLSNVGPNVNNIGLYTMVGTYLPWIESVLWP